MSAERGELFIGLPENWCPWGKCSKTTFETRALVSLLTWMVLGLVFFLSLLYFTNKMMCITIHLFSTSTSSLSLILLLHDLFFWTWGSLFSANSTLSCLYSISGLSWTVYIHMKGFLFFCSPWQVCISQSLSPPRLFCCWLADHIVIFSLLFVCTFCTF